MDAVSNPFASGAGTPPPELAGRDELREIVRIAIQRVRRGLPTKSDELQYVEGDEFGALIIALHRTAQRRLPIVLLGVGLPQLRGRMGRAKSNAERLFDFPEMGALDPAAARIAIAKPAAAQGVEASERNTGSGARWSRGNH